MVEKQCPLCHRMHEVADDGTIPTWVVTWDGQEAGPIPEQYPLLSGDRQQRLAALRERYGRVKPASEGEQGEGFISNRLSGFIHREDAISEYNWIKNILVRRGDWSVQKTRLVLREGERAKWADLFEEPGICNWEA